jgi:type II pantothenate kinase
MASTSKSSMNGSGLPGPKAIHVDTRGAKILVEESPEVGPLCLRHILPSYYPYFRGHARSLCHAGLLGSASPQTRDSRGIYLPNYIEPVSHIAVDVSPVQSRRITRCLSHEKIGGSLAKVVYFTRSPDPPPSPEFNGHANGSSSPSRRDSPPTPPHSSLPKPNGALTPLALDQTTNVLEDSIRKRLRRRASLQHFPGGSLNFARFETERIDECVAFVRELIRSSAEANGVSEAELRRNVKMVATGGGAHRFYELLHEEVGVEVSPEDEMECLIEGLKFITLIPDEVYYFSDTVEDGGFAQMERPSPNPPKFAIAFEQDPTWQLPCLLVNIGSGVSIIKVDEDGSFERVSGTSLGGGTLWGLLSLLTPATSFDGQCL